MSVDFTSYYSHKARTQPGAYTGEQSVKTATQMFLEGEALSGKYRHIIIAGKSRAGKTWGVLQLLKGIAEVQQKEITIVRQTMPVLRQSVLKDLETILAIKAPLSIHQIHYCGGTFRLGDGETAPLTSDITFINQAEEISYDFAKDLNRLTRDLMIYDLSEVKGTWIEKEILSRPDCAYFQTNYLDNPFITQEQIDNFEDIKRENPEMYKQFVLAE